MTREEMEMRKLVRESDVIDKTNGTELAKAFNYLWKKYIEQEPCEDCISRQAVIDLINADWEYEGLEVEINNLPSVTPKLETVTEFADRCRECGARYGKLLKQKTGHWILRDDICKCSNCKDISPVLHNYCPNCGAKMESEDK